MKLDANDKRHLQAAEGWLELGDWQSANDELLEIVAARRAHRDVLKMRYRIYTKAKNWKMTEEVIHALLHIPPGITIVELQILLGHLHRNDRNDAKRDGLIGAFWAMKVLNKQYKIKPYNTDIVQGVLDRLEDSSVTLESIVEWVASMSPIK